MEVIKASDNVLIDFVTGIYDEIMKKNPYQNKCLDFINNLIFLEQSNIYIYIYIYI